MHAQSEKLYARLAAVSERVGGPFLAVDTSSSVASLALVDSQRAPVVIEKSLDARALPSEQLFESVVSLVGNAGLAPKDLRALVVGLGPGSFTGLRVGLASIKGMALATKAPVYGFTSSLAMALPTGPGITWVIGDARRQSVHLLGVLLEEDAPPQMLCGVACVSYEEAKTRIEHAAKWQQTMRLVGDGIALVFPDALPKGTVKTHSSPSAAWGADSVRERLLNKEADDVATLAPLYLQEMALPPSSYQAPV